MCHGHGGLKPIPNTPGTRGNKKKKALRYLTVIYTRVSHSVKQCKQLLEGWVDGQLQETGKLLDGDASSFT